MAATTTTDVPSLGQLLPEGTVYIDPDGDLDIIVGQDDATTTFRVSSKALSLASPVWRQMLSGKYKERNGSIDFPGDDAGAFFIVLLASHLKFTMIPGQVELSDLFQLCVICDKYDCIAALKPWLSTWTSAWVDKVAREGYNLWIFIAWVLGEEEIFRRATDYLVSVCKTNTLNECLNQSGVAIDDYLPPGLAEKILDARHSTITQIIEACHSIVVKYAFSGDEYYCQSPANKEVCNALVYGYLIKKLQKMEIWPGDPNEIAHRMKSMTVQKLITDIKSIISPHYPSRNERYYHNGSYFYDSHTNCGWTNMLHGEIDKVIEGKVDKVIDASYIHLETQKQKLMPSRMQFGNS